jgi:DNA modification methylase
MFRHFWMGMLRQSEKDVRRVHPTQKPRELMKWVIENFVPEGSLICDPYAGSGTTLYAGASLGHKVLGFEIEPDYCRESEKLLRVWFDQPKLFNSENCPSRSVYKPKPRKTAEEKAEEQELEYRRKESMFYG